MICRIAELTVEIPAAGGLALRCGDYLVKGDTGTADVVIRPELYRYEKYPASLGENGVAYMESAYQFYRKLVEFDGFYLHSSAVVVDGRAYLFSGPSRVGKSTHTRMWQKRFGERARVINDDKPALRRVDGIWMAYGTPWCGKDGINLNEKAPLAGVCYLRQAKENRIRRLTSLEAMQRILSQTIYKFDTADRLDQLLGHLELFLEEIPVFELENLPEEAAAALSYETMSRGVREK